VQKFIILQGFVPRPGHINIGYVVSTLDQNLDLQVQTLRKAGCKKIFREKVSPARAVSGQRFNVCSIAVSSRPNSAIYGGALEIR
jgi:hypothetical protein